MVRHGAVAAGQPGRGRARRALCAPGRSRPGARQKPGQARAPWLPGPPAQLRAHTHVSLPPSVRASMWCIHMHATAHHAMRVSKASSR
jgi:hypothetical protein